EQAPDRRRAERSASDTASRQAREELRRSESEPPRAEKPRRVDRLRSMARERTDAKVPGGGQSVEDLSATPEATHAGRPDADPAMRSTVDSANDYPAGVAIATPTQGPSTAADETTATSQGAVAPAADAPAHAVGDLVNAEVPPPGPPPQADGQGTHSPAPAGGTNPMPSAANGETTGGGSSPGGHEEQVAATAVRSGGTAGRAGATNHEFQQLLGQLGRQRIAQAGPPDGSPSAAMRGKPTAAPTGQTLDVESPESLRELARVVRTQVGSQRSSMTLDMSPPELGRVRVDVRMVEHLVTVRFQTETSAGREAIQGHLHELKGVLEQQGIQVDRMEVDLRPPAPSSMPEREGGQPSAHGEGQQTAADYRHWQDGRHGSGDETGQDAGGDINERDTSGSARLGAQHLASDWRQTGVDVLV
ncbi:MAG: flagellar hook-length control protein FliK, partial [Planctomycetes bacterium]|nr:flagellar hook-length control protein FliK [Planctomycetota bacterium]